MQLLHFLLPSFISIITTNRMSLYPFIRDTTSPFLQLFSLLVSWHPWLLHTSMWSTTTTLDKTALSRACIEHWINKWIYISMLMISNIILTIAKAILWRPERITGPATSSKLKIIYKGDTESIKAKSSKIDRNEHIYILYCGLIL